MTAAIYKICSSAAWAEAQKTGSYSGSPDDRRDGYIHMSTAAQLAGTLARHFSDQDGRGHAGLVLVRLDPTRLGSSLKWEPARDGSLFPHLYGSLDPALATSVATLALGSDGRHLLPAELT